MRTEYTPKPCLAPVASECVFDVPDVNRQSLPQLNPDHIEPGPQTFSPAVEPRAGHALDFPPLGPRHRLHRVTESERGPGLDLHKGNDSPLLGDDIDLEATHSETMFEYRPAAPHEEVDGDEFALVTPFVAFIGPVLRVGSCWHIGKLQPWRTGLVSIDCEANLQDAGT